MLFADKTMRHSGIFCHFRAHLPADPIQFDRK